jgi:hypothetical protein
MPESNAGQIVELEIVRGQAQQRRRPVAGPAFLMGTSCECDLVLSGAQFSEVYACFLVHPGEVTMRQVGEGPAILINGRPTSVANLRDGDRISAGPFEFVVRISRCANIASERAGSTNLPSANRWSSASHMGDSSATRIAARLLHDIRMALDDQRALRRPA